MIEIFSKRTDIHEFYFSKFSVCDNLGDIVSMNPEFVKIYKIGSENDVTIKGFFDVITVCNVDDLVIQTSSYLGLLVFWLPKLERLGDPTYHQIIQISEKFKDRNVVFLVC